MAEKEQLKEENMRTQEVNQSLAEEINNGEADNNGQGPIDNKNKSTQPSASKIYLPGFIKRKCTTLEPHEQGPSMPKLAKLRPHPDPNMNITIIHNDLIPTPIHITINSKHNMPGLVNKQTTESGSQRHDSSNPEPTEEEQSNQQPNEPEQNDPESTTSGYNEPQPNDDSDTDTDSSDSETDSEPPMPRPGPRVMTDPDFDEAVSSVFTPMEPAVVVETLPVINEPSTSLFSPMDSVDMVDTIPRIPRPTGVGAFSFTPLQLLDAIEPSQRVAYCFCRRRADLERLVRAKRRRELLMIRKPPLVLTCRAYEHGVEAVLSNSIQSSEESVISSDLRTFVVAERLYTSLDKSVAAIIFGIKRYHKLLKGKRFTIVTDQPTFVKVFHPSTLFQVVPEKWNKIATALSLFNYNIIYRPSPPKRNLSPSLMLML